MARTILVSLLTSFYINLLVDFQVFGKSSSFINFTFYFCCWFGYEKLFKTLNTHDWSIDKLYKADFEKVLN